MRLLNLRHLWAVLKGFDLDNERWVEAEAAESRATLRNMGIFASITGSDIKNVMRWGVQSRREQLSIAWEAQAAREALNIASVHQEGDKE